MLDTNDQSATRCRCGFLAKCVVDPAVRVIAGDARGRFVVHLTQTVVRGLKFCFLCGGKPRAESAPPCRCSALLEWTAVAGSSVRRENRFGEFQVVSSDSRLVMYYCPACGGLLPRSKRSEYFLEPAEREIADIEHRLEGAATMRQILAALGSPDRHYLRTEIDKQDERIYGVATVIQTLVYSSIAGTFELCVQELEDQSLRISFLKKPRL